MASSCCWLPPLLIVMGVSGAGMASALEQYRPLMMVVTFSFLGAAFYFTYRRKPTAASAGKRPRLNMMTLNKAMLWVVAAMAVVFLFFPQVFMNALAGNDELSDNMNHSYLRVEGMTCEG